MPSLAQPQEYTSPSSLYTLNVYPLGATFVSPASYRFSKNGQEVWSGEKPYTLRKVAITDDGFVVGVGYTSAARELDASTSKRPLMHIVIIGEQAQTILDETHEMLNVWAGAPYMGTPFRPIAEEVVVNRDDDRAMIRVLDVWDPLVAPRPGRLGGGPAWWIYTLSSGNAVGRVRYRGDLE
jgi:hypothetical protein